jgi:hypothetical protein
MIRGDIRAAATGLSCRPRLLVIALAIDRNPAEIRCKPVGNAPRPKFMPKPAILSERQTGWHFFKDRVMFNLFRSRLIVPAFIACTCLLSVPSAKADKTASGGVVSALQQKYQITETSTDSEQITKDGTTMVMKTAGIYSFPSSTYMKPDNKVIDGKIKSPSFFVKATWEKMGAHVLQNGDKVYITKMGSKSEGGDTLTFTLLSADSHDTAAGAQKKFLANVSFVFKKGYLDETPPDQVEQVIESVLAPDTGDDKGDNAKGGDNAATQQAAKPAAPAPAPAPAPPPPPPAPAAAPATITIGESSTEVLQAMGMPLQMIDLGVKKTYVYKNMKIIFKNDKVADVQ